MLSNSFKCLSFARICDVKLSHSPLANLAHLQYVPLLVPILPISYISQQYIKKYSIRYVNKHIQMLNQLRIIQTFGVISIVFPIIVYTAICELFEQLQGGKLFFFSQVT